MRQTRRTVPHPATDIQQNEGSGKTTLILKLIPQLPKDYKIALLKNECVQSFTPLSPTLISSSRTSKRIPITDPLTNFWASPISPRFGDLAIDTQLATTASIAGVHELLNGCICCNLVGQLGPALSALRASINPLDRIIIETSGSAFPATLALEINRIAREEREEAAAAHKKNNISDGGEGEEGGEGKGEGEDNGYVLDGVVSVIDVENWKGYEDTSVTAKMQAKFTDLIVLNKWERAGERRLDEVLDRIGDLECGGAVVRSEGGRVDREVLLGLDGRMVRAFEEQGVNGEEPGAAERRGSHGHEHGEGHEHEHGHGADHQREVEVLSITLSSSIGQGPEMATRKGVNLESLETFLLAAPKDEIYRIKAIVQASSPPASSGGEVEPAVIRQGQSRAQYILNWAFGRWTFTPMALSAQNLEKGALLATSSSGEGTGKDLLLRMTVILARGEAEAWKKRIENQGYIEPEDADVEANLEIKRRL